MEKYKAVNPESYVSPLPSGIDFEFVSGHTIYPYFHAIDDITRTRNSFYMTVKTPDLKTIKKEFVFGYTPILGKDNIFIEKGEDAGIVLKLIDGIYIVEYEYVYQTSTFDSEKSTATYTFKVVENKFPLKPWTITSVINRAFELCEPLRKGEKQKQRFRLNGMRADGKVITPDNVQEGEEVGQAYKFDKINCPQLSFTKCTLREVLQEIGKVIHGEPRLKPKKDENGWYYEVSYDMYGRGRMSHISKHKPYLVTSSHAIEQFCSSLDSSAENLINTLDKYSGVITEPYRGGSRTVRTESLYVRVTDANMLIETQYPIYSVEKLEYVADDGTATDITPYVFETSEYNRLSSYGSTFPDAKLYALRYSMGSKNIDGLNFKRETGSTVLTPYGDYSIIAIIQQASGNTNFSVSQYPTMKFRVTYTPIYNTRVAQTKPYYKDVKYPAGLFFNQQSNLVETKYYGENLKGAVARLGNVEKTLSYILYKVNSIPRVGDMYDEDYMISAVSVEWQARYIRCTIALTKSFNRISQFIGVSSEKRFSEISEKQAVERNVLYREYVVIGTKEEVDEDSRIGFMFMRSLREMFLLGPQLVLPVTCVAAWGRTYKDGEIAAVLLPVVSSAFGNSVSFSWRYEDNYSAGTISQFQSESVEDNKKIEGYFQNAYRYTDNYGKIYYYYFDLRIRAVYGVEPDTLPMLPTTEMISHDIFSTIGQEPYILRKDNREALQVSVQIDFVTNQKGLIIGSALASYCGSVRGISSSLGAKLYVFDEPLDKFVGNIAGVIQADLSTIPSARIGVNNTIGNTKGEFYITGTFPASGKAWAIVTEQKPEPPKMFEDEFGNEEEIREISGGEVLLAQNMEVTAGQELAPIYFTPKREVFDKSVWVDRK